MTRYILMLFLLISYITIYGQVSSLPVKEISVSYNKTTHIVFPTDIKYFTGVEELIILKQPLSTILSIKANVKDFGDTNLNVATADGKFYAFKAVYSSSNTKTSYFLSKDSIGQETPAKVNIYNLLHIVLPNPVKYIDYGSDWIDATPIDNIQNIVRVEILDESTEPTNISIVDDKQNFYSFAVSYDKDASDFNLVMGEPKQTALLAKEDLTDYSKEGIMQRLKSHGRVIKNLGLKKNSIIFTIHNIFVADNKLIFRFNFKNTSHVKYDIDYMKFYIIDKKQTKESALQEIEYAPLFLDNFKSTINGKEDNTYSVCFDKFTIPDKKNFVIEINEKDGGRHINYKIDNRAIENAQEL
ncbi:conjugative transposon TraN protein [Dysgonomonas sp. PFB1-18]|uniref:conjugative transposon protein TraN n=1 Tax=unclassified Dysgonomonas TaxID=2630389 RepID=UPI0024754D4C|nr:MULTISPECIES: conjugative transposon protein TraN [unclassified Dysgonomonas]MDH6311070.1 conjugative transposon TraN protein [Dysgonomonas sp. PF1-14]MDH6340990.1 conjugative transposon TraN protein [Dysgonomonas sp. PF1-16]MDH6382545.1 conjugative transposon TraN protein [Dysgonomonas sp. PFB1-18]MDH6399921.1 conjugative transposon TraN protein [Dysgonomonas sp. PF1-23]